MCIFANVFRPFKVSMIRSIHVRTRIKHEEPEWPRRGQEGPGGPRRTQEGPGGFRREGPGGSRKAQGLIWGGGPPYFTRVFGFDCDEGLIWGGGPLCFTRVFGFDCGEGLIWGGGPRVLRGFWDLTAARA